MDRQSVALPVSACYENLRFEAFRYTIEAKPSPSAYIHFAALGDEALIYAPLLVPR